MRNSNLQRCYVSIAFATRSVFPSSMAYQKIKARSYVIGLSSKRRHAKHNWLLTPPNCDTNLMAFIAGIKPLYHQCLNAEPLPLYRVTYLCALPSHEAKCCSWCTIRWFASLSVSLSLSAYIHIIYKSSRTK